MRTIILVLLLAGVATAEECTIKYSDWHLKYTSDEILVKSMKKEGDVAALKKMEKEGRVKFLESGTKVLKVGEYYYGFHKIRELGQTQTWWILDGRFDCKK